MKRTAVKVLSIMLSVILFITLCGCGETKVKFVATIADITKSLGGESEDLVAIKSDYPNGIKTDPYYDKREELVGTQEVFLIKEKKMKMKYTTTVFYPDETYIDLYKNDEIILGINHKGDYVRIGYVNRLMETEEKPITTEQRKNTAQKIVLDFFGIDVTDFEFSEIESSNRYDCTFKYYLYGKYTGQRVVVQFSKENDKHINIYCQTGIYYEDMKNYPDFDRDECYEVAKNKLLEGLKPEYDIYYYANYLPQERYIEIEGKLYYLFEFILDSGNNLKSHTEYTGDVEQFRNNTSKRVKVLVELITE